MRKRFYFNEILRTGKHNTPDFHVQTLVMSHWGVESGERTAKMRSPQRSSFQHLTKIFAVFASWRFNNTDVLGR